MKLKRGIGILTKQGEAVCIYIAVVILLKECVHTQNKYLHLENYSWISGWEFKTIISGRGLFQASVGRGKMGKMGK